MEEIEQKPKHRKLKIFGIVFGILFLALISISVFGYYKYNSNFNEENLVNEIKNQLEEQTNQQIQVKPSDRPYPLSETNPGFSFQNNSGYEVAYVDHIGNFYAIGNLTVNYTTGGYGYFRYLGSSVSRITKGWFTDIDVSGTVNTTYANATTFYEGGGRLALNSSLINYLILTDQRFNETNFVFANFYNKSSNMNLNSYNLTTTGTGFFGWLGGSVSRITKLWATDIDTTNATITNLNVTNIISNVNMTSKNITDVNCIKFASGGTIFCSL